MTRRSGSALDACPCGSGAAFDACCGAIHRGAPAPTAEALMRARYSAYARGDADFVRASWHPDTRPDALDFDEASGGAPKWIGLTIRGVAAGGEDDELGTVEFVARYRVGGRAHRLHELSEFVRHEGRWVYVRGLSRSPEEGDDP